MQPLTPAANAGAVRAERIRLPPSVTVAEAFQVIGQSCLRQCLLNERAVLAGEREGIHQMRVALRRLRAAMSLFQSLLGDAESEAVKGQLRWLTEQLGPVRDLDVFLEHSILPLRAATPDARELSLLEAALRGEREHQAAVASQAVRSERFRKIAQETAVWLAGGEWSSSRDAAARRKRDRRFKRLARKILARRTKKLTRRLALLTELQPSERHQLRIAVKKLHYGTQFFASLFRRRTRRRKRFLQQLERLQDVLGKLNDLRIHEALTAHLVSAPAAGNSELERDLAQAMGLVVATEAARVDGLLEKATHAGKKLARLPRFWKR
jgi:CHAD domain-containing protein